MMRYVSVDGVVMMVVVWGGLRHTGCGGRKAKGVEGTRAGCSLFLGKSVMVMMMVMSVMMVVMGRVHRLVPLVALLRRSRRSIQRFTTVQLDNVFLGFATPLVRTRRSMNDGFALANRVLGVDWPRWAHARRSGGAVGRDACYRCITSMAKTKPREHTAKLALDAGVPAWPYMSGLRTLHGLGQR